MGNSRGKEMFVYLNRPNLTLFQSFGRCNIF